MVSEQPMSTADEASQPPPPPNPPLLQPSTPNPVIPLNFPIATKLNQNNYLTWKSQVQPIIHGFNLTHFLEESPPDRTICTESGQFIFNPALHAWNCQDQMLLGWIRSSLTESIQGQVAACQTTADLWSRLKSSYSAASNARLNDLRRQINSTAKGSSSCIDYLNRMRALADELSFIGFPMTDGDLTSALLNGLGPEYNSFVTSVTTSSRHQPFSFSDLHGMLLSYESRLQGQSAHGSISLPSVDSPNAFLVRPKSNYPSFQPRTNNPNPPGYFQTRY